MKFCFQFYVYRFTMVWRWEILHFSHFARIILWNADISQSEVLRGRLSLKKQRLYFLVTKQLKMVAVVVRMEMQGMDVLCRIS